MTISRIGYNDVFMMDKDKRKIIPLPDEKSPDYFSKLRTNCIISYEKFMDDRLALDYNKVVGKMRPLMLEDKIYQQETKHLRAKAFLESVEELDDITYAITNGFGEDDDEENGTYDPRGLGGERPKKKKRGANVSDKDLVAMRLKALETKREMLSLDRRDDEAEESDGLNIFFISLTEEEFRTLDTVEVHDGKEVDKFEVDEKSIITGKTLKKRKDTTDETEEKELVEGVDYTIGANGEITEL